MEVWDKDKHTHNTHTHTHMYTNFPHKNNVKKNQVCTDQVNLIWKCQQTQKYDQNYVLSRSKEVLATSYTKQADNTFTILLVQIVIFLKRSEI